MDISDIHHKINTGVYSTSLPFPASSKFSMGTQERKEALRIYREDDNRCLQEFKTDLFASFDVANHPKAEKAFDIAWDDGHAAGLHEVLYHFERLVDLLK